MVQPSKTPSNVSVRLDQDLRRQAAAIQQELIAMEGKRRSHKQLASRDTKPHYEEFDEQCNALITNLATLTAKTDINTNDSKDFVNAVDAVREVSQFLSSNIRAGRGFVTPEDQAYTVIAQNIVPSALVEQVNALSKGLDESHTYRLLKQSSAEMERSPAAAETLGQEEVGVGTDDEANAARARVYSRGHLVKATASSAVGGLAAVGPKALKAIPIVGDAVAGVAEAGIKMTKAPEEIQYTITGMNHVLDHIRLMADDLEKPSLSVGKKIDYTNLKDFLNRAATMVESAIRDTGELTKSNAGGLSPRGNVLLRLQDGLTRLSQKLDGVTASDRQPSFADTAEILRQTTDIAKDVLSIVPDTSEAYAFARSGILESLRTREYATPELSDIRKAGDGSWYYNMTNDKGKSSWATETLPAVTRPVRAELLWLPVTGKTQEPFTEQDGELNTRLSGLNLAEKNPLTPEVLSTLREKGYDVLGIRFRSLDKTNPELLEQIILPDRKEEYASKKQEINDNLAKPPSQQPVRRMQGYRTIDHAAAADISEVLMHVIEIGIEQNIGQIKSLSAEPTSKEGPLDRHGKLVAEQTGAVASRTGRNSLATLCDTADGKLHGIGSYVDPQKWMQYLRGKPEYRTGGKNDPYKEAWGSKGQSAGTAAVGS